MLRDKFLIFWYNFQIFAKIYYDFTLFLSKFKEKSIVKVYSNFFEIKNILSSKEHYVPDYMFGILSDYLLHPGVVQHRLDTNQKIGDCDEHAIYWCTTIKKSKLAKRVWFAYFSFKKLDVNTDNYNYGAHAVCVFKGLDNKLYWCDYNMPIQIEKLSDFQVSYCQKKKAVPIVGCLWNIDDIDIHDTPIFGKITRVLPGEDVKI